MRPLAWMAGASIIVWLVATGMAGRAAHPEILLGMIGPLLSACLTWVAVVRAFRCAPDTVTRVLMTGFAVKMVFFGAYLVVMLRVVLVRPMPFAVAFTGFIIGLYAMEAFFLTRLTRIRQSDL